MDGSDSPTLEVGFEINTGGSFDAITRLDTLIDKATANAITEFSKVERASKDLVNLAPSVASMSSFGNAATRAERDATRAFNQIERAGESMLQRLEKQNGTFGKTTAEIRAMKAEAAAAAAQEQGLTKLAQDIRAQEAALYDKEFAAARRVRMETEAAAEAKAIAAQKVVTAANQEAEALRLATQAHGAFEAAVRRGMQALREQEAAAASDAAALARLRAMIDPAAAAQDRLNAEMEEATRVMRAVGASEAEIGRAHQALTQRVTAATQQHELLNTSARKSGFALQTVALQLPDITQGLLTGQKPMTVFIQQGFQIVQVAQMAEGGLRGFGRELGALALRFAPLLAGVAAVGAGFGLFVRWVNQGVTNDQLTRDLGKITGGADATKQELFKLRDATITWGDVSKALFSEVGKDIAEQFVADMKSLTSGTKATLDDLTSYGGTALAGLYAGVAGTKAYMGEVSSRGGLLKAITGDPTLLDRTYGESYRKADAYLTKLGARVKAASVENARNRLADGIGYNNLPKPKIDRAALETEAVEAQIRNLYLLADAYADSGAAALIAEARVKAESDAIKKQGDVTAFVDRQVRLAIAERVKAAGQSSATIREQARLQSEINAEVANGNVPVERANELLQQRAAELPLVAAIEAAYQFKRVEDAAKAEKELARLRDAYRASDAAAIGARYNSENAANERRLVELREELRLVGATDAVRVRALATIRATAAASGYNAGPFRDKIIADQVQIAALEQQRQLQTDAFNASLTKQADLLDVIAENASRAGQGLASAFGSAGQALGDLSSRFAGYIANQERLRASRERELALANQIGPLAKREAEQQRINGIYAARNGAAQVELYGDMAASAKGFFKENSAGYRAAEAAEKAFRAVQFAMSVQAMIQNAAETLGFVTNSAAKSVAAGTEGIANQSKLPFPFNIAAMAATGAALVAAGIAIVGGGGGRAAPVTNTGTGTVLGDRNAQSESVKRSIDALKEVDTLMLTSSRAMAASLRSIDAQIGSFAAKIAQAGNVNASADVQTGFKTGIPTSGLASFLPIGILGRVPVIGDILKSLFGTKTSVIGSGLFGGAQSLGDVLSGGFDASYYSDVEKKKKLFGITTSTKYSTALTGADPALEQQFTLIMRSFSDAISAAAGSLGVSTGEVTSRLSAFVIDIGKIDLQGLSGEEIQSKLTAVFGAAADNIAAAALPGFDRFQRAGEGMFETVVRVASTVEQVTASLGQLGAASAGLGIDAKMGIAAQFDSIGDFTNAVSGYFEAFYTPAEQNAARLAQLGTVFTSLGTAMPATLAGFRSLVEAQDLTTAAGQATYATLLQLAPAFADLKKELDGAKSAADILSERGDLQRQLLELAGNTAAIRALDLAKLDASNRGLQQQVWAVQDAQKAADAAKALRDAWASVGDSIMDEVKRIRGLTGADTGGGFMALQGQFNAATKSARGGDQDAAKLLPGLSQSLLKAAEDVATSRQELARVQAATAASLEQTYGVISAITGAGGSSTSATLAAAATAAQASAALTPANDDAAAENRALREEMAGMRRDLTAALATIAGSNARIANKLDDVTAASGGDAISTVAA